MLSLMRLVIVETSIIGSVCRFKLDFLRRVQSTDKSNKEKHIQNWKEKIKKKAKTRTFFCGEENTLALQEAA